MPNGASRASPLAHHVRRSNLDGIENFGQGADLLPLPINSEGQDQMNMFVHDRRRVEQIAFLVVVNAGGQNSVAGPIEENCAHVGYEGDEMWLVHRVAEGEAYDGRT